MNIKQISNFTKYDNSLDPIEIVLNNRGIDNVSDFFQCDWDSVQTPYDLDNIELAAKKILEHIEQSKTIALIVDNDMDGFSSSAVFMNYITAAHAAGAFDHCDTLPEFKFLFHETKTHGLSDVKIMKDLRDLVKPALLIIPDASGTQKEYDALNDLGIDIVTLDHHDTYVYGNEDDCIIVNNQHSDAYLNKSLTGVGVVYQITRVFDDILCLDIANNSLDLVAVGLVGDVADLRFKETRFLVTEGLAPHNIRNPFLKHFIFAADFKVKGELNPIKVAFNLVPLFNAVARIGTLEEKEIAFRALLNDAGEKMVPSGNRNKKNEMTPLTIEAYRIITNAKSRQTRRQDKFMLQINQVIEDEGLAENKVLVITIGKGDFDEEHRALAGLVCNKFQEAYSRPCIIMFENENRIYTGSCRAPDTIEAFSNFREQCVESGLCAYALGHSAAFGISTTALNSTALQEYFNNKYENIDVTPTYNCDFVFDASDAAAADCMLVLCGFANIWGQGIKEPLVAFKNVLVGPGTISLVGQQKGRPTLRVNLKNGVVGIKFGSSAEEFDALNLPFDDVPQYYNITLVGRAEANVFRGETTAQLKIVDYSICGVDYDF